MEEKIYDTQECKYIETPEKVKEFFIELKTLCLKYNLSISHEDIDGGFIIENYSDDNLDWLSFASLSI